MRFARMPHNLDDISEIEAVSLEVRLSFATTHQVIQHAATTWPEKPAIIFLPQGNAEENPVIIDYQNLLFKVNQAANLFQSLQATNGNVVSYLLGNLPQTHFALWGAQAVGIVQPLRPDLSPEQITHVLRKSNSETLVTLGEFIPGPMWQNVLAAREILKRENGGAQKLKTIFVIGGRPDEANGIYDFDQSLSAQSQQFTQPAISPDAVCAYFHTSATTMPNPKLVRLTQRAIVFAAWAMGTCLGFRHEDIVGVALPFFHVGAPGIGGQVPFMCGATTVMMSPMGWMDPNVTKNFWEIVQRYRVTITAALNFTYSQLLHMPGIENNRSLRLAISGTALSSQESEQYKKLGIQVTDIYGSSETTMACFNPPDNPRFGSMGLRFPYEQMKVMRPDEHECAIGEIGELWISGPNLTQGYQESSQDAFTADRWFKTGDLVRKDAEGYFWFFDRTADVINQNGNLISSLELEHIFEKHPKVDRAAVIAQPDPHQGEVPVLFVTAKLGCELYISELQQWAHEHIDALKSLAEFFIETAFPLNGIAKIVKPILRERNDVRISTEGRQ